MRGSCSYIRVLVQLTTSMYLQLFHPKYTYVTHIAWKFLKRMYYKLNMGRHQIYFDKYILQNDPSPKVVPQTPLSYGLGFGPYMDRLL